MAFGPGYAAMVGLPPTSGLGSGPSRPWLVNLAGRAYLPDVPSAASSTLHRTDSLVNAN